jgi:hypothetical protein
LSDAVGVIFAAAVLVQQLLRDVIFARIAGLAVTFAALEVVDAEISRPLSQAFSQDAWQVGDSPIMAELF